MSRRCIVVLTTSRAGWRGWRTFAIVLAACLAILVARRAGAEVRSTDAVPSQSQSTSASTAGAAKSPEQRQKQIVVALLLLMGITLAGLMMVGFAMLWGARTRRIARQPLPAAPRGDELWFLKKPLPTQQAPASVPTSDSPDEHGGPKNTPHDSPPVTPPETDSPASSSPPGNDS